MILFIETKVLISILFVLDLFFFFDQLFPSLSLLGSFGLGFSYCLFLFLPRNLCGFVCKELMKLIDKLLVLQFAEEGKELRFVPLSVLLYQL